MENNTNITSPDKQKDSGQSYNISDAELIRQLVKSRLEQKQELEYEDLDGYVLPPRTQFSMLKKPAVTIKYGRMRFNMACIRLFENVEHILTLVHPEKKRLTIVMCAEEQSGSVEWARRRQADNEWVNKDITSEDFIYRLYQMMGWKLSCRYKVLGRIANSRDGLVLVFELDEAVMFDAKPIEIVDEETGEIKKKQVKFYPDTYKDAIGKSYNDYVEARQMNLFEYLEEYNNRTYSDNTTEDLPTDAQAESPPEHVTGEVVTEGEGVVSAIHTTFERPESVPTVGGPPTGYGGDGYDRRE